jgi:hypothetical protein
MNQLFSSYDTRTDSELADELNQILDDPHSTCEIEVLLQAIRLLIKMIQYREEEEFDEDFECDFEESEEFKKIGMSYDLDRLHFFEDTLKDRFITHLAMRAYTLDEIQTISVAFQSIPDYHKLF